MDHYEVLGVTRTASREEIKKAYYARSREMHPDRVAEHEKVEATEKFKHICAAYETLSDDQKRSHYDRHGHSAAAASGPVNLQLVECMVTLDQIVKRELVIISLQKAEPCGACNGTGFFDRQPHPCRTCRGAKTLNFVMPCPGCRATGRDLHHPACMVCGGQAQRLSKHDIPVTVPEDYFERIAEPLLLPEHGIAVRFVLSASPDYTIQGHTLTVTMRITLSEALTGFRKALKLPTHRTVAVEALQVVVQPGAAWTVPEQGLPLGYGHLGPLKLVFEVEFPQKVSGNQGRFLLLPENLHLLIDQPLNVHEPCEGIPRVTLDHLAPPVLAAASATGVQLPQFDIPMMPPGVQAVNCQNQ